MKTMKQTIAVILVLCLATPAFAQESPTMLKINEGIREINDELNSAKAKMQEYETAALAQPTNEMLQKHKKSVTEVRKAQEEYAEALAAHKRSSRSKNAGEKARVRAELQAAEGRIRKALTQYARANADFIAANAHQINTGIKQVRALQESFARILLKFVELEKLAKDLNGGLDAKTRAEIDEAKRQAVKLAKYTDVLRQWSRTDPDLDRIVDTIDMQCARLLNTQSPMAGIRSMLKDQRNHYQHVLVQLKMGEDRLVAQKNVLQQVALACVTKNMLMKASHMLVGVVDLNTIGVAMQEQADARSEHMAVFVAQDRMLRPHSNHRRHNPAGRSTRKLVHLAQVRKDVGD